MSAAGFDAAGDPVVAAFLAHLPAPRPVSTEVSFEDEMFLHARASLRGSAEAAAILYFLKGRQVLEAVRAVAAWRFGGLEGISSVLDFASGRGRFTRFLVAEVPPERVTVSEIDRAAVAFGREAFGVRGVASALDPSAFDPGGTFDLVLASSFFTHVPPDRFAAWLARLWSAVSPGGVLLFSTHGPRLAPAGEAVEGVLFRPESETSRLSARDYGTTWATEAYVVAALGEPCLAYPFGFCAEQDLYVASRPGGAALSPDLRVPLLPRGDCDLFTLRPDGLATAEGWVSDPSAAISLFVGSREAGRTDAPGGRWRFQFDWRGIGADEVLRVEASSGGVPGILAMSPLGPHLPGTR